MHPMFLEIHVRWLTTCLVPNHQFSAVVLAEPEMQVPGQQWPAALFFFSKNTTGSPFATFAHGWMQDSNVSPHPQFHQLITDWQ